MKAFFTKIFHSKKARAGILAALLIGSFFYCSGKAIAQGINIKRLSNQLDAYQQQLDAQIEENEQLEAVLESDNKDAYIEQKAREKGYVKSNEIVFYDISGSN